MQGLGDEKIISIIKADEELVEASNSYCVRCGRCCTPRCRNKEVGNDDLVYCLLHNNLGNKYPSGKVIPEYEATNNKLDPDIYAKPLVCHTYGPHLSFLFAMRGEEEGKLILTSDIAKRCRGAVELLKDYKTFLKLGINL